MNAKTKIKIYRTVIEDVCKEYENTREFIHNKINELCSEHGMSADEVRLYIFMFVMPRTQFGVNFLHQNGFALKCKPMKS